ncbi:hypothetical protein Q4F19_16010 [Sphingomonas sp. BIUV-7]|uniref:Phage shock protein B n=1 Tax=Sphingomonas natans TaxID=3063330 RepID=A0ABT8YC32_9SPHN|nr:hypothetical protein [Sphingomonas sp. BIUV-7]MDO6415896.1 hypothetical protein [Sphingomonas sp. BIUV-7]
MGIWHFVWVVIPLAAISAGVLKRWFQLQERKLDRMSHDTVERAAQYAAKTERLEQRVAVLERILTDRSTHLGDEIERLRGTPIN